MLPPACQLPLHCRGCVVQQRGCSAPSVHTLPALLLLLLPRCPACLLGSRRASVLLYLHSWHRVTDTQSLGVNLLPHAGCPISDASSLLRFFSCAAGTEFMEMFTGVGASRVRDMFQQARKNVSC